MTVARRSNRRGSRRSGGRGGLSLPPTNLVCYLDKRYGITLDAGETEVQDWVSQWPATGPVASDLNDAQQPAYSLAGGLVFDGADDYLQFAAGLGAHTNHTLIFRMAVPAETGENYLFDCQTGRIAVGRTSGNFGAYGNSVWNTLASGAASAIAKSTITVLLDAGAGSMVMRINGSTVTLTGSVYVPTGMNGTIRIGSNYNSVAAAAKVELHGLVVYSSVLSGATLLRAERYMGQL